MEWQPSRVKYLWCSVVSTPSAMTRRFSVLPNATMADTIVRYLGNGKSAISVIRVVRTRRHVGYVLQTQRLQEAQRICQYRGTIGIDPSDVHIQRERAWWSR
jgi:hypothetical protein